jgi:hypothetical protein
MMVMDYCIILGNLRNMRLLIHLMIMVRQMPGEALKATGKAPVWVITKDQTLIGVPK